MTFCDLARWVTLNYRPVVDYVFETLKATWLTNWAIALATIVYVVVTARTLKAIQKQSHIAAKAADSALLNARAAMASVRPWIVPTEFRVDEVADREWVARITLRNTGNSPATDCAIVRVGFALLPSTDPLPDPLPYQANIALRPLGLFGATGNATSTHKLHGLGHLPLFQKWRIGQAGARLYLFGEVTYRDAFGGTDVHRMEFCYYSARSGEVFNVADVHNSAR